jgi:hypothetical protein
MSVTRIDQDWVGLGVRWRSYAFLSVQGVIAPIVAV